MLDTDGTIHRPTEDQKGWGKEVKREKKRAENAAAQLTKCGLCFTDESKIQKKLRCGHCDKLYCKQCVDIHMDTRMGLDK